MRSDLQVVSLFGQRDGKEQNRDVEREKTVGS